MPLRAELLHWDASGPPGASFTVLTLCLRRLTAQFHSGVEHP